MLITAWMTLVTIVSTWHNMIAGQTPHVTGTLAMGNVHCVTLARKRLSTNAGQLASAIGAWIPVFAMRMTTT
jgi:hypothetical protein